MELSIINDRYVVVKNELQEGKDRIVGFLANDITLETWLRYRKRYRDREAVRDELYDQLFNLYGRMKSKQKRGISTHEDLNKCLQIEKELDALMTVRKNPYQRNN